MVSGCICVNVNNGSKSKPHQHKEKGEKDEDDREDGEDHEGHGSKKGAEHGEESGDVEAKEGGKEAMAKLMARAKVSETQARAIALSKVPGGTIKEGGLEEENGKLLWSFDIATPGSKDITEVGVDAITGKVLAVAKETPAEQAKEREEDEKKPKQKEDLD